MRSPPTPTAGLLGAALYALNFWGDEVPGLAANEISNSTAPAGAVAPQGQPAGALDDTPDAVAARILMSDRIPGEGRKDADVEIFAARIAAA